MKPTVTVLALAILVPSLALADTTKQARDAFAEGTRNFDLGKMDEAIDAWQRGYTLKPDPIFLYNIAQAHRIAERFERATFFYKSYLRNAPKASNRDEVLERIAQLEQLMEKRKQARDAPPALPMQPDSRRAEPEPAPATPPPTAPAAPAPAAPAPGADVSAGTTVTKQAPARRRRGDLSVSGGVNLWLTGVPGGAQPSAGVEIGGYAVLVRRAFELRIGAQIGYTYLVDLGSTEHFLSVLADPKVSIQLWREKLYAFVDLGVGALVLTGVQSGSVLLKPRAGAPGTIAAFEIRPAVGLEFRVHPMLAIYLAPSVIYSPMTNSSLGESSLLRFDVNLGASIRL